MRRLTDRIRESLKTHGAIGFALVCLRIPLGPLLRSDFGVRLNRAYQGWIFDHRFGVDTSGWIRQPTPSAESSRAETGNAYDGSSPAHFKRIVQGLGLRYEDYTFVDFGSGKGRVLLLASAFPFRRVVGVEWSQELHEVALRNLVTYTGPRVCNEVESFCMDAAEFPIPSGKAVLYFYNPFKGDIMVRVLLNVGRSLEADLREIIIVYMNPRRRDIFDGAAFVEKTADKGWFVVYKSVFLPSTPN
jgi:SAM-dependent methyltransferase